MPEHEMVSEVKRSSRDAETTRAGLEAWLATKGFDRAFGARPMARLIERVVKKPLSEALLFGSLASGGVVIIGVKDDVVTLEFTK